MHTLLPIRQALRTESPPTLVGPPSLRTAYHHDQSHVACCRVSNAASLTLTTLLIFSSFETFSLRLGSGLRPGAPLSMQWQILDVGLLHGSPQPVFITAHNLCAFATGGFARNILQRDTPSIIEWVHRLSKPLEHRYTMLSLSKHGRCCCTLP
jgi:hypothetical protein